MVASPREADRASVAEGAKQHKVNAQTIHAQCMHGWANLRMPATCRTYSARCAVPDLEIDTTIQRVAQIIGAGSDEGLSKAHADRH